MKYQYGKPKNNEPFFCLIYCGMCNEIPIKDLWSGGEHIGTEIGRLYPLPMMKMIGTGEKETVTLMICKDCVMKIEESMRKEIMRRFPMRPPDEGEGGVPVRR